MLCFCKSFLKLLDCIYLAFYLAEIKVKHLAEGEERERETNFVFVVMFLDSSGKRRIERSQGVVVLNCQQMADLDLRPVQKLNELKHHRRHLRQEKLAQLFELIKKRSAVDRAVEMAK